jgi:uncharacterized delta-60 repeat protein
MRAFMRRPVLAAVFPLAALIGGLAGAAHAQAAQLGSSVVFSARAGDLDPSFGVGGTLTTDGGFEQAKALVVQGDKLVATGLGYSSSSSTTFALARYNPDGTLDASFGTDGKVITDFIGIADGANALAVQGNKVVAAGFTFNEAGLDFALARYNPDGTLDASFGTGGEVTTDFDGGWDSANALAVQADGKLVAAGSTESASGISQVSLARYNDDGTLDSSFGIGGRVITSDPTISKAFALAVQPNGRLVVAGVAGTDTGAKNIALARYRPNGSLDTSFGTDGTVTTDLAGLDDQANALAVQANGQLVVAGTASFPGDGVNDNFALARYRPNGSLDTSFGSGGTVTTDFAGFDDWGNALALQADGGLVVAGEALTETGFDFGLARYTPDGILDTSFGAGGKVTTDIAYFVDGANALAVQGDGKLVAAGFASVGGDLNFAMARYIAQ